MSEAFRGFVCTSAAIDAAVSDRAVLTHPYYQAFINGKLSRDKLAHFAREYAHHVWAFPRVVSAIHTNCPDALGRRLLAKNLAEEEGLSEGAVSHADLWFRFAQRVGVDEAAVSSAPPSRATQDLIDTFHALATHSYALGLGALYAYENQLPQIAPSLQAALRRHYDISDEASLAFFQVHEHADLEHSDVCRELLDKLPRKERAAAYAGACTLADQLLAFLTGLGAESERAAPSRSPPRSVNPQRAGFPRTAALPFANAQPRMGHPTAHILLVAP
jgi:pyrroloquinoline-quinone synthase